VSIRGIHWPKFNFGGIFKKLCGKASQITSPQQDSIRRMELSDRELFTEQVREHHAGLRGFVRSLGVNPLWVDDVAQEAFIFAYNRLDEFDRDRDFGAWLRGIARNLVINERRKDARRKRILSDNLTDVLLSTSSVAEDEDLEMGDTAMAKLKALRECIGGLPEKSLLMLKSRYENENSAHEIAEEFEMKPPAVRKALERIRTSLRKCMEERLSLAVST
jgi:RNA polymerase sigma-70 factor (ECF subfamily)